MRLCYFSDVRIIHVQRWMEYFRDRGHEVHLISVREGQMEGVRVYNIGLDELDRGGSRVSRCRGQIKKARTIRSVVSAISPDIVHLHFLYNSPVVFALSGIRNLIVSLWGADIVYDHPSREPWKVGFIKRFILGQAREITVTSNFLAGVTRKYVSSNRPIRVIPFGIDLDRFRRSGEPRRNEEEITLAFIKHLNPKYGPEYLLRGMPRIVEKHPAVKLLMIGGGELEASLKKTSDDLGIGKNVEFVGAVPNQKVKDYLEITDIFVMPSVYESESFGVAALESAAMEVPVVPSRIGGVSEVVVDGETGILVKPRDTDGLVDAILALIENPELRRSMGRKGRELVTRRYDWVGNAHQMEALYERVVRG